MQAQQTSGDRLITRAGNLWRSLVAFNDQERTLLENRRVSTREIRPPVGMP